MRRKAASKCGLDLGKAESSARLAECANASGRYLGQGHQGQGLVVGV